jgi:hypothetical protein
MKRILAPAIGERMAAGMLRRGAVGPECAGSRAGGGGSARVLHITKLNVVRVNFASMGKTQIPAAYLIISITSSRDEGLLQKNLGPDFVAASTWVIF